MALKLFKNGYLNTEVTTISTKDGDTFFRAVDVARSLGYVDTSQAIRKNVSEKYKSCFENIAQGPIFGTGQQPSPLFLSEPGLYQLIFLSSLPIAREFEGWVFEEVSTTPLTHCKTCAWINWCVMTIPNVRNTKPFSWLTTIYSSLHGLWKREDEVVLKRNRE